MPVIVISTGGEFSCVGHPPACTGSSVSVPFIQVPVCFIVWPLTLANGICYYDVHRIVVQAVTPGGDVLMVQGGILSHKFTGMGIDLYVETLQGIHSGDIKAIHQPVMLGLFLFKPGRQQQFSVLLACILTERQPGH